MTKADLIAQIAIETGFTKNACHQAPGLLHEISK